ncbi:MAG: GAF domain-containing protein [Chloroflexi bacterium]|nr:GAF domain-containing protein [Chloroflexota bacterium]
MTTSPPPSPAQATDKKPAPFRAARHAARINYTLRTKLILAFLAVALVPLGLLAFLNDRAARASLTETANQALFAGASQTAANIDNFINNTLNTIHAEAQLPELSEYLDLPADQRPDSDLKKEVAALLQIMKNKDARIFTYSLLDRQGWVVASNSTLDIGADKSRRDYFQAPRSAASTRPYVSPVDFSEGAESGSLFFSTPVRSAKLETVGVLVVRYNADILQQLVAQSNGLAGPDSFGVLFDENHIHLAHGTAPDTLFKTVAPLDPARLAELQAAGRLPNRPAAELSTDLPELETKLANAAAQPFFTAHAARVANGGKVNQVAVTTLKTQPWSVAFFQPREVFLALAEAQTRGTLLLAALIAALVAAAAVSVSQILARPIARLTGVAMKVTEGDLAARAVVEAEDEIGALATAFNSMTTQLQQTLAGLEQRVAERTAQLQAAADIGRATTSVRDLDELLRLALQLIRERFGFYHASIFLMDKAGEFAALRESTGEVGAQLKARGHRLGVGSHSLIGWVTQNLKPRVALDTAEDPYHFKNPLLPETRSELAIPLLIGDRLLGALDVQSTALNAFSESDVQVLQTLADQLSVAIQNAELFQSTQTTLAEVSSLYQQMTGTAWHTLLRGQARELVFELQPGTGEWPPAKGGAPIEIPLRLRGEVVGSLELHGRPPGEMGMEEQAVLETVAAQLSVALESAALLEEAQRRSRREQLISAITDQMRSTLNPATILQSGIRGLGQALGATEVVVKLGGPLAAPPQPVTGKRAEP